MSTSTFPYTPPVDQPPPVSTGSSPYGGFWVRLAAHFVDGIIIWLGAMLIMVVVFLVIGGGASEMAGNIATVVVVIGGQLYHAYFISSARMATPGKRLCGLYVTDLEGRRLGFGRALGRNLAAFFSYITLYIGFIMAGFTEKKQALHDKLAGTLVHRQPGSSAGIVIGIVVAMFIMVFVVGILAAVAIPAYQDYTVRAKIHGLYQGMTANKAPISEFAQNTGAWPTTWQQIEAAGGANPMTNLRPDIRALVEDVRLEKDGGMVATVKAGGSTGEIRLAPAMTGSQIDWTCTASPEVRRIAPLDCRK